MMKFDLKKGKLLVLLVFTDVVFLILHILHIYSDLLPESLFSLARDRGYAELFQYTKELWIGLLFLLAGIRQRKLFYFVFSGLFVYFLIDDSFRIHENFGVFLADWFEFPALFGLRPVDFGEMLVYAYFSVLFVIAIGIAYLLSDTEMRRMARSVILLVAVLMFFGVFMDMLEIMIRLSWAAELVKMVEDGGEMVVMSVITAFVFYLDAGRSEN